MYTYYFEDYLPGSSMTYGPFTVTREEMLAFSREFDAQTMHVDEEAAKKTFAGGLIASGWGTAALNMRAMCDGFILETASMGGPGIIELKWLRPVLAGDILTGTRSVQAARPSASKPDRGVVTMEIVLANQKGEPVYSHLQTFMVGRRGVPQIPSPPVGERGAELVAPTPASPAAPTPFLDDLVVGHAENIGYHSFTEEEMIRFGRAYDPQPFHIDPAAAKAGFFGGLIASGWHTGSMWMQKMVEHRKRSLAASETTGIASAELGPSPGFKDLNWLRPVYAGDTISYINTCVSARPSASRPGWGIATHHNAGINQFGQKVFEFTGAVMWQRKSA